MTTESNELWAIRMAGMASTLRFHKEFINRAKGGKLWKVEISRRDQRAEIRMGVEEHGTPSTKIPFSQTHWDALSSHIIQLVNAEVERLEKAIAQERGGGQPVINENDQIWLERSDLTTAIEILDILRGSPRTNQNDERIIVAAMGVLERHCDRMDPSKTFGSAAEARYDQEENQR